MGKTLSELAAHLVRESSPCVQLIYAFNGVGKTRLSREFSKSVTSAEEVEEEQWEAEVQTLYYNAFTEDLFQWDNDPHGDVAPKLLFRYNTFIEKCVGKDGKEGEIVRHFQRYIGKRINAEFSFRKEPFVSFSIGNGHEIVKDIKISRGEESCFVWSLFYTFLKGVIDDKLDEDEAYPKLKYIFIDDPVSSLDENHLVEVAVDIAELIKKALEPEKALKSSSKKPSRQKKASKSSTCGLKWVVSTHNPLFCNVLRNCLKGVKSVDFSILSPLASGAYEFPQWPKDTPFPYHLYLLYEIEQALTPPPPTTTTTEEETPSSAVRVKRSHFAHLRYILEKTAVFLGYAQWSDLLPKDISGNDRASYYSRLINIFNHGKAVDIEGVSLSTDDEVLLQEIVRHLNNTYHMSSKAINEALNPQKQ